MKEIRMDWTTYQAEIEKAREDGVKDGVREAYWFLNHTTISSGVKSSVYFEGLNDIRNKLKEKQQ